MVMKSGSKQDLLETRGCDEETEHFTVEFEEEREGNEGSGKKEKEEEEDNYLKEKTTTKKKRDCTRCGSILRLCGLILFCLILFIATMVLLCMGYTQDCKFSTTIREIPNTGKEICFTVPKSNSCAGRDYNTISILRGKEFLFHCVSNNNVSEVFFGDYKTGCQQMCVKSTKDYYGNYYNVTVNSEHMVTKPYTSSQKGEQIAGIVLISVFGIFLLFSIWDCMTRCPGRGK